MRKNKRSKKTKAQQERQRRAGRIKRKRHSEAAVAFRNDMEKAKEQSRFNPFRWLEI